MDKVLRQSELDCMDRIANIFKFDRKFVIDKMNETVNQGRFTTEQLEKSLMEVVGMIETEEQFISICTYLAYMTFSKGCSITYAMTLFLKVVCKNINLDGLSGVIKKHQEA